MPVMASIDNPLGHFRDGAMASADGRKWPIPLAATRIDVTIRGGLAIVTTERIFRNAEPCAIEATLTFPVPVDATLCALSALPSCWCSTERSRPPWASREASAVPNKQRVAK